VRRKKLQQAGTELRKFDSEIIGKLISAKIFEAGKDFEKSNDLNGIDTIIFLIDSLKNLNELIFLKRLYLLESTEFST